MREPGRLITAMATPFRSDGSLDIDGAARLAEHLVETGTETVLVNGTTGESPTLYHEEKLKLLDAVIAAVGERSPVMMGTGSNNTAESITLTREAEAHGASSVLLVAPYYNRPPQEGLVRHFTAIAAATSLPVMLYNVPTRTVTDILPETVAELSRVPNIFAIKEASGQWGRTTEIVAMAKPGFRVYSGDDVATLAMMALGAFGVVSVASHLAGRQITEMMKAHVCGDNEKASAAHQQLLPLFKGLFTTTSPILLKSALNQVGLPSGPVRLPLVDATPAEASRIRTILEELKLL